MTTTAMPDKCPRCGVDAVPEFSRAIGVEKAWQCGRFVTDGNAHDDQVCRLRRQKESLLWQLAALHLELNHIESELLTDCDKERLIERVQNARRLTEVPHDGRAGPQNGARTDRCGHRGRVRGDRGRAADARGGDGGGCIVTLPEQIEGLPVETWAIESFLGHMPDRKEVIVAAIDGGENAVEVARSLSGGGRGMPNGGPSVFWSEEGICVWADDRGKAPSLTISYERVVEYVRQHYAEQRTLF